MGHICAINIVWRIGGPVSTQRCVCWYDCLMRWWRGDCLELWWCNSNHITQTMIKYNCASMWSHMWESLRVCVCKRGDWLNRDREHTHNERVSASTHKISHNTRICLWRRRSQHYVGHARVGVCTCVTAPLTMHCVCVCMCVWARFRLMRSGASSSSISVPDAQVCRLRWHDCG